MWKVKINSISASDTVGIVVVELEYFNGERSKVVYERVGDKEAIRSIAQSGVNALNKIDDVQDLLDNPPLGEIEFTTALSPEAIEKQDYETKRQKLVQAKQDLELGLIKQDIFDTLLAEIKP